MTTHSTVGAVVILLLSSGGAAPAQTTYSRVTIGDRWYIRCLRESNELPPGVEVFGHWASRAVGATLVYGHRDQFQPRFLYYAEFGPWGTLEREELIDPSQPPGGAFPLCDTNPSHTWSLRLQDSHTALAQVRDVLGDPIGPSFAVSEGGSFLMTGHDFAMTLSPTAAWITQEYFPGGPVNLNILLRKYTVEGQLLGAVTVANTSQSEEYARITEAPNGSLYIAYLRGNFVSGIFEAVLQRVDADLRVSEPIVVDVPPVVDESIYARALADNTILVAWARAPFGSAAFARRYNLDLTPAGPAIPIDPAWRWAHADSAGNLLVGRDPGQAWVRLYDAAGNARSDRVPLLGPPEYPQSSFNDATRPFILKDDGTIYAVYVAMGNFDLPDDSYVSVLRPYLPGDCNYDRRINNFDIDAFVLALRNGPAYEARYYIPADVGRILGDVNFDGALNNFDIDPFVELLVAQP